MNEREFSSPSDDDGAVHSIELWYSRRRQRWIVERLDGNGDVIGPVHQCAEEDDARDCLQHWLRAHAEAQADSYDDTGRPGVRRTQRRAA